MTTPGRTKELIRIFQQISEGGQMITSRTIKKFLNSDVNTDMLPTTITQSDFIEAFDAELSRLKDQEDYLVYQISQYKTKTRRHLQSQGDRQDDYSFDGIMDGSKFEFIVEEARDLPAMNTNNTADSFFTVKCDDELVSQSQLAPDTAEPIWNEKVSIPIIATDHLIEFELWDDDSNPELIGSFIIELGNYEDQQVHCRWYDLEGPEGISSGEVKITGQWIYSMAKFHNNCLDKYDRNIMQCEKMLAQVSEHQENLYTLDGKQLLMAWFNPPSLAMISAKSRRGKHFLSIPSSRHGSLLGSPRSKSRKNTRYSSFKDIYNSPRLPDSDRYLGSLDEDKSFERQPIKYDFLAIGIYLNSRIKQA